MPTIPTSTVISGENSSKSTSIENKFVMNIKSNIFNVEESLLVLVENIIWPILLAMTVLIAVILPQLFRGFSTIELIFFLAVPLGLLALAEGICLLSGNFDLSVGAIAGFSAMFTGMAFTEWNLISSPEAGILLILLVGAVIGLVNGFMIAIVGVNPFLQTLAFFIILHGAKTALNPMTVSGLPEGYTYLGNNSWTAVTILFAMYLIAGLTLRYTDFGQAVYAVGSDQKSARSVGINTNRVIIMVFTISGILSSMAGLMLTGYLTVVPPDLARGSVFPAFAAAVIGGISLFGGRGKIIGVLGGVLLLGIIQAALNVSGVAAPKVEMVNGIVLLLAIVLYTGQTRLRNKIITAGVGS